MCHVRSPRGFLPFPASVVLTDVARNAAIGRPDSAVTNWAAAADQFGDRFGAEGRAFSVPVDDYKPVSVGPVPDSPEGRFPAY